MTRSSCTANTASIENHDNNSQGMTNEDWNAYNESSQLTKSSMVCLFVGSLEHICLRKNIEVSIISSTGRNQKTWFDSGLEYTSQDSTSDVRSDHRAPGQEHLT